MKFRICGGLDAPDWILAEIVQLAKLSSVRFKLLAMQIINHINDPELIDYEKVKKLSDSGSFELSDVRAMLAALRFIICNAVKYGVDENALATELQQLGLPPANSKALLKPYRNLRRQLRAKQEAESLHLPHVDGIQWRVVYSLTSRSLKSVEAAATHVRLTSNDGPDVAFKADAESVQVLIRELRRARGLMDSMS